MAKTKILTKDGLETLVSEIISLVNNAISNKANKSTTLSGYGITNAYTKTEVNNAIAQKSAVQIITWGADD